MHELVINPNYFRTEIFGSIVFELDNELALRMCSSHPLHPTPVQMSTNVTGG